MKKLQIAVIWSAWSQEYAQWWFDFDLLYKLAYQCWYELAKSWCIVVTGWKSGIMEWASQGAKDWWGMTVGIVKWSERGVANIYVDVEVVTNMWDGGDAFLIPYTADAAIVIWWGVWTLKEISGFYLQWKPLVSISNTWWRSQKLSDKYLDERKIVSVVSKVTPKEAVDYILSTCS